jgi:hypothetical protein
LIKNEYVCSYFNLQKSLDKVDKKREEHLAYVKNFILSGKFLVVGRKNPVDGAVIIAHNLTKKELEEIFKNDPYYMNGLAEYSITEFNPASFANGVKETLENLEK